MSTLNVSAMHLEHAERIEPENERELRIQLAAAYRLIDRWGMSDVIYNHITARVPGEPHHFLINPYGLMYHEVRASNLVKVDYDGNVVGEARAPINRAGFVLHSAIHRAREDVNCIAHTHSDYGVAVSTLACGLLPLTQTAMQFYRRIGYNDYEGISRSADERVARVVADLGQHPALIMRNHGLLTVGRTVPEALVLVFYLERACRYQILAQSAGHELVMPAPEICEETVKSPQVVNPGELEWPALMRWLDRSDPSYRE